MQDRNIKGDIVRRTATISQEYMQRAKCLTHLHQSTLRLKRISQIELEEKRKIEDKDMQLITKVSANDECCACLYKMLGLEESQQNGESHLSDVTITMFGQLKIPQLVSFIIVRNESFTIKSRLPKKGKLADAIAGENNLIKIAFDSRCMPNYIKSELHSSPVPPPRRVTTEIATPTIYNPITPVIPPSAYLKNDAWVKRILKLFDPDEKQLRLTIDDTMMDLADILIVKLRTRLTDHINTRIDDEKKREHWSMKWANLNLPPVAAYMTLCGHIKNNIICTDANQSLLCSPKHFLIASNNEALLSGCYLYYDRNNECWIRSGKVVGRSFADRDEEHRRMATKSSDSSKFYLRYPSKNSTRQSQGRNGYFENLSQMIACGFKYGDSGVIDVCREDVGDGGILCLSRADKDHIIGVNFRGRSADQKFLEMVSYQFELVYDLCIGRLDNVSGNPGFEGCLGIF